MPNTRSEDKKLEVAKEELRIVRKFLRRNNLDQMYALLQQIGGELHGAKVVAGSHAVPADEKSSVEYQNVHWDSDGYFDDQEPTRWTVPTGLGGRYFVQVAIRWLNTEESHETPPLAVIRDSYYYAFVSLNGSEHPVGSYARSTANKVGHGATGTTQHFTFDLNLGDGDFVEVKLWQDFYDPVKADVFLEVRRIGDEVPGP